MTLYGKEFYFDKDQLEKAWYPSCFFEQYEQDMSEIMIAPQIVNWYGKLDIRNINRKDYKKIPVPLILEMRSGMDVVYPDIITSPIFMVSEEALEVILLYDKQMPFLFLGLFDLEKGNSISYYCPILAEESNHNTEALYYIKRQEKNEIKICEELAESLLERGVIGLGFVL